MIFPVVQNISIFTHVEFIVICLLSALYNVITAGYNLLHTLVNEAI